MIIFSFRFYRTRQTALAARLSVMIVADAEISRKCVSYYPVRLLPPLQAGAIFFSFNHLLYSGQSLQGLHPTALALCRIAQLWLTAAEFRAMDDETKSNDDFKLLTAKQAEARCIRICGQPPCRDFTRALRGHHALATRTPISRAARRFPGRASRRGMCRNYQANN
jgi:hypothetical protein